MGIVEHVCIFVCILQFRGRGTASTIGRAEPPVGHCGTRRRVLWRRPTWSDSGPSSPRPASAHGRAQLAKRLTVSATVTSLSARSLGEIEVPVPTPRELDIVARLVEASEAAYGSAVEAARLRRETLRDAVIREIARGS